MISSGLVLNDENRWVAFHSGYDFGYLLKVLTNMELPEHESEFFDQLKTWFGNIYDLKYMVKSCPTLNHRAGLNHLASELKVCATESSFAPDGHLEWLKKAQQ